MTRRILIRYAIRVYDAWREVMVVRETPQEVDAFLKRHDDLHGDGFQFLGTEIRRAA